MAGIKASVGKYGLGKPCFNFTVDQEAVQNLLNKIPPARGGAGGALTDPIIDRTVSDSLYQAILNFQKINRVKVDGHVDPYANTIQLMNRLAGSFAPSASSSSDSTPAPSGLSHVDFWLNAFIPNSVCTKKGDLFVITIPTNRTGTPIPIPRFFTGDQRDFSSNRDASARMHSEGENCETRHRQPTRELRKTSYWRVPKSG
jgi:peptidoglycan hydrolase-like protein with peptidoglycan-binding domain